MYPIDSDTYVKISIHSNMDIKINVRFDTDTNSDVDGKF